MNVKLARIRYSDLNSRQKENYNFMKLSAVLADFGFVTLRLTDDWQGADFIAQHIDGETFLRVQLKSRLTFQKKYRDKGLYIGFGSKGAWYLYPHDEFLAKALEVTGIGRTESWTKGGGYSFPHVPAVLKPILEEYRLDPGLHQRDTKP